MVDHLVSGRGSDVLDMEAENILLSTGKECHKMSNSVDEYVQFLTAQVVDSAHANKINGGSRQNIQFYRLVRGGNTKLVKAVLQHLTSCGMTEERDWLLGITTGADKVREPGVIHKGLRILWFVLCSVLFFLLTPIFYCVHAAVLNIHITYRKRLTTNVSMPFVYAVLSENNAMIDLFMENGCKVRSTDRDGNNVFHYLADLSIDDTPKAIRCHECVVACCSDEFREVLMNCHNDLQFTAFELIGQFGAVHYLHYLLESRGCIGVRKFAVSKETVWDESPDTTFDLPRGTSETALAQEGSDDVVASPNSAYTVRIWEVDMAMYERGDIFGKQSYLLHLLTGRSVDELSESDATALFNSKVIASWMDSKLKLYGAVCVLSHVVSVVISLLFLVYAMMYGGDMRPDPMWNAYHLKTAEYAAKGYNYSSSVEETLQDFFVLCGKERSREDIEYMIYGEPFDSDQEYQSWMKQVSAITYSLAVLLGVQALSDLLLRLTFLWNNFNFTAKSALQCTTPAIFRWIPGSYTEKQLSALIFIPFTLTIYFNRLLFEESEEIVRLRRKVFNSVNETSITNDIADILKNVQGQAALIERWEQVISGIFVACLLLRFLHNIHALRLLPGIGFFIITTKKMARHLFHFGVVFGIVLLTFALMFHLCIRNPLCPGVKNAGYSTLTSSMFSTYQVSLGQGDTDHFEHNFNSQFAYIACTMVIIIMLLNLIIAVMTTTATSLSVRPWKQLLYKVEVWDEILGVEAQVLTWTRILRACGRRSIPGCAPCPCKHGAHTYTVEYYDDKN